VRHVFHARKEVIGVRSLLAVLGQVVGVLFWLGADIGSERGGGWLMVWYEC